MSALALISDLVMGSHTAAAAQRAGVELALVATEDLLVAKTEGLRPRLVIVDLSHPGLSVPALAGRLLPLLPEDSTTVAFGQHVHKERLSAAAEAGFRLVLSRGQFHADVESIFRRYGQP